MCTLVIWPSTKQLSHQKTSIFYEGDHTHFKRYIHPFNGPLSRTIPAWASTRKVKPIWILLKQETVSGWHQLGHMQVCTLLQTNNHASTPPLSFLQAACPSCCPTNSIKALKANIRSCIWWDCVLVSTQDGYVDSIQHMKDITRA